MSYNAARPNLVGSILLVLSYFLGDNATKEDKKAKRCIANDKLIIKVEIVRAVTILGTEKAMSIRLAPRQASKT